MRVTSAKIDEHIEQERQLELVREGVADLLGSRRPSPLPQRDVGRANLAAAQRASARNRHPDQEGEGQEHLDEERQEDGGEGHEGSRSAADLGPERPRRQRPHVRRQTSWMQRQA